MVLFFVCSVGAPTITYSSSSTTTEADSDKEAADDIPVVALEIQLQSASNNFKLGSRGDSSSRRVARFGGGANAEAIEDDTPETTNTVRTYFPETWLWDLVIIE